jgi:Ca-activated chloride channel family protein
MKRDHEDPRITAYLFNELAPEEMSAFEDELERCLELRQLVEQTRATVEALRTALGQEEALRLSDGQRAAVESKIGCAAPDVVASGVDASLERTLMSALPAGASRRATRSRWWLWSGASAAAALILAGLLAQPVVWSTRDVDRSREGSARTARSLAAASRSRPPSGAPVAQPDAATWEQLTTSRNKYQEVEAAAQNAAQPEPAETQADFDSLVDSITSQVQPQTWDDVSGNGRIEGFPPNLSLVINQSQTLAEDEAQRFRFTEPEAKVSGAAIIDTPDHGAGPGEGGDKYEPIVENDFLLVADAPLSTFSIDVDTASYAKVRMYLNDHQQLPRPDAVRIEELINYFPYSYDAPSNDDAFKAHLAVVDCPWNAQHRLVRIGIKGKEIQQDRRPASNLVFLLDVSGSMDEPNKLPLLKRGMKMLVDQLGENDRVAIVVYAGAAGRVLDSTTGDHKAAIVEALDRLDAGGSTNGGAGIQLAYQTALDHFRTGGVNRVILCTDGDFNVGTTGTDELVRIVRQHAQSGVFLSVLGFGMGNHNDSLLEQISNQGNGNYAFIDTDAEARKVLVEQLAGTLVTIAKDVKIQVEFNPARVAAYRLIGYENRMLAAQDFNDDTKDAGEIGAGHTVTAFYEIVPAGQQAATAPEVDELKYQTVRQRSAASDSSELLTLKMRFKQPEGSESTLLSFPLDDSPRAFDSADADLQFAAAVASFGMLLRDSKYKGNATYASVLEIATSAARGDNSGYRDEFLALVRRAAQLAGDRPRPVESRRR